MAGSLRYTLRVNDTFGTRRREPVNTGATVTVAADPRQAGQLSVVAGGQGEVVPVGDISSAGFVYLRNDDATNYIEWGPDSGGNIVVIGKLMPGEDAWFRISPAVSLRARANTADCPMTFERWSA